VFDRTAHETSVPRRIYGWRYWRGAALVVLALLVLNSLSNWFNGATVFTGADIVVWLISWPFLIAYHVIWTRRRRT